MVHSFNTEVAKDTNSILSAVILRNLAFWIAGHQRMDDERYFKNGKYWVSFTLDRFASFYSYATKNQIFYAIQKLIDTGYLQVDKTEHSYARQNWYSLSEKAEQIFRDAFLKIPTDDWKFQKSARASNMEDNSNTLNKKEKIDKRESSELSSAEDSEVIQTAENIWKIYPRKTKYTETLLEIKYAILREYRKLGDDPKALKKAIVLVYNAAARYSNRVRRYSPEEQKYVISSTAFFRDCRYLDDPETWKGAAERSIVYNADGTRRGVL